MAMASLELPNVMLQPQEPMATWWLTSTRQSLINFACSAPCTLMRTFPRHLLVDPSPSPEQEGGPPTWEKGPSRGGGGFICCHALAMAAGHCAAGFCHQLPACRRWYRQQQQQWQGRRDNHDCHCCGEEAPSSLRQGPSPWHEPLQPS